MTKIIDTFHRYWLLVSSAAIATIYYLYQRRGRTIQQLHAEAQKQILVNKLAPLAEQATRSQEGATNALQEYNRLKSRHADTLRKLGLLSGPNKPDSK